jgi:hypothetical protein
LCHYHAAACCHLGTGSSIPPRGSSPPFAKPHRSPCTLCPRSVPTPTSLSSPLTSCFARAVARRAVDVLKSLVGVFYTWRRATVTVPPRRDQAHVASSPSTTPLELAQLADEPLLQCAEPLSFVIVRRSCPLPFLLLRIRYKKSIFLFVSLVYPFIHDLAPALNLFIS